MGGRAVGITHMCASIALGVLVWRQLDDEPDDPEVAAGL